MPRSKARIVFYALLIGMVIGILVGAIQTAGSQVPQATDVAHGAQLVGPPIPQRTLATARTDAWPLHHGTTAAKSSRGPRVAMVQFLIETPRPKANVLTQVRGTLKHGSYTKGLYGFATAKAVVAYKFRLGYPSRGQCGAKSDLWRKTTITPWFVHLLKTGDGRQPCWIAVAAKRVAAVQPGATPLALKLKNVELSQVGTYGSYRYATFFHVPTYWAWCAVFQEWGRAQVGLAKFPAANPWYVPSLIEMGENHVKGMYLQATAVVGATVLYYRDISHVGYVVGVEPNGYYWTTEGNYGNRVAHVHHSPYDHLHYFLIDPKLVRK